MNLQNRMRADNVAVFYRKGDSFGESIAQYYQAARKIPAMNIAEIEVLNWQPTWSHGIDVAEVQYIAQQMEIVCFRSRVIHSIVLCGDWPQTLFNQEPNRNTVFSDYIRDLHISASAPSVDIINEPRPPLFHPAWLRGYANAEMYHCVSTDRTISNMAKSGRGYVDQPPLSDLPAWEPDTAYDVGDTVIPYGTDVWLPMVCTTAGTSGPSISSSGASLISSEWWYLGDGTCDWKLGTDMGPTQSDWFWGWPQRDMRQPRKIMDALDAVETSDWVWGNIWTITGANEIPRHHELSYTVFLLTCGDVQASDPDQTTRLDLVKRIIDDGIAAEANNWMDIPGKTILSGQSADLAYPVCLGAYYDYLDAGQNPDDLFHANLQLEYRYMPNVYPDPQVSDKYQPGDNDLVPQEGTNYTPISDIFFHFIANKSYFPYHRPPWPKSQVGFVQGGIAGYGQSCGHGRDYVLEIDYFYGTHNLLLANNTDGEVSLNPPGTRPWFNLNYTSQFGLVTNPLRIRSENPPDSPPDRTIEVTADNQIVCKYDGAIIATINLPPDHTLQEARDYIKAALPAEYEISMPCPGPESRAPRAIKNGACLVLGSAQEPTIIYGFTAHFLIRSLLAGDCAGEAMRKLIPRATWVGGNWTESAYIEVTGDPLYRPFHAREENEMADLKYADPGIVGDDLEGDEVWGMTQAAANRSVKAGVMGRFSGGEFAEDGTLVFPGFVQLTPTYNNDGTIQKFVTTYTFAAKTWTLTYTYDAAGNVSRMDADDGLTGSWTRTFTYDGSGSLLTDSGWA